MQLVFKHTRVQVLNSLTAHILDVIASFCMSVIKQDDHGTGGF